MDLLKARTIIIYFTLLFSFGCVNLTSNAIKPSPILGNSVEPTQSTNPTITPGSSTPSPSPTVELFPTSLPTGNLGGDFVLPTHVVTGYIYDKEKKPLAGVNVSIKLLNNQNENIHAEIEFITDFTGKYYFRGIAEGTDVEITASKPGYIAVIRNANINGNEYANVIFYVNFGGDGPDAKYALEKIN